jgi:murein DD-endopeptidase MepM/ murein hydrolase activator NlpD
MSDDLPLPGPAERDGEAALLRRYNRSSTLALLNPFQLAQVVRQIAGEVRAYIRWRDGIPAVDTYRQQCSYTLPFEGEWYVMNGGTDKERSHSWEIVGQRYAYDFVVADSGGRRHRDDGSSYDHYFAYSQPVLAPAEGVVVAIRDGVRDAPRVGTGWVDWLSRDFTGNSVTIQHADREFSFLAHLIPGSIVVRRGQRVDRGTSIARCGNSGHSTEPHLHFQVQDQAAFFGATSLPVTFSDCIVDGAVQREAVYLQRGQRVRRAREAVATG